MTRRNHHFGDKNSRQLLSALLNCLRRGCPYGSNDWAEWTSNSFYLDRINNICTGNGPNLNGTKLEAGFDVIDDAAADTLRGGSALDWFFADLDGLDGEDDLITDSIAAEFVEQL